MAQPVFNLPNNNIKTIKDLFNWIDKEIGLDTEICRASLGDDLGIYNKSTSTWSGYAISFTIDLNDKKEKIK